MAVSSVKDGGSTALGRVSISINMKYINVTAKKLPSNTDEELSASDSMRGSATHRSH
jgi:hypothetical protein